MSAQRGSIGTSDLEPHKLALEQWLLKSVPGFDGPLDIERFSGGQSNPTYKLTAASGCYVLRRKPTGVLLKGAHAIEREARIQSRLAQAEFPVARVHGLCTDETIVGAPFYVMELVDGRIFWDATVPEALPEERAALYDAMNDTIAKLHRIDFDRIGLGDYGRTGAYFTRQIARWSEQYRIDVDAGRDAGMDRLIDWLDANVPEGDDEVSIIHGDFRIDNLIFHRTEPRVLAVIDWELSTLGHPGADFAYHAMMYRVPPHVVAGLKGADIAALGLPSEADYIAAYCRRTGRTAFPNFDFYLVFNLFRLAAIFHGIKGRISRGNASSASARERVKAFPELVELALAQARS